MKIAEKQKIRLDSYHLSFLEHLIMRVVLMNKMIDNINSNTGVLEQWKSIKNGHANV